LRAAAGGPARKKSPVTFSTRDTTTGVTAACQAQRGGKTPVSNSFRQENIMNAKIAFASLALTLISLPSFADDTGWPYVNKDVVATSQTRAQVRAELVQAQAAGETDGSRVAWSIPSAAAVQAVATRAQVRDEIVQARARGELDTAVLAYGLEFGQERASETAFASNGMGTR
jgi:hypothetical protein